MRALLRRDLSPRLEMLPLIDVVFLLLTFFIYAMVMSVQLESVRVAINPVGLGVAQPATEHVTILIRLDGQVYLGREPVGVDGLLDRLKVVAARQPQPIVFLLLQDPSDREEGQAVVDRGPIMARIMGMPARAGIRDFRQVGPAEQ